MVGLIIFDNKIVILLRQDVRILLILYQQFSNSEREKDISIQPMIYKADLVLHSGKLERLSTLKRYGDATLTYKDNVLNIEFGFEFKLLKVIKYIIFFNFKVT